MHNTEVAWEKDTFYIKGPMGRGLHLTSESQGHYFAFCGGTGVLVFLDIVAYMIIVSTLQKENQKLPEGMTAFHKDFVFHLYASFQNKSMSIGFDIMRGLESIAKKLGLTNFVLKIRLSDFKDEPEC